MDFSGESLVDFTPFELWLVCFRSVGLLCTVIVVLFMQNVDLKQLPMITGNVETYFCRCATNADCRLADWQVSEINIVVKFSNRFCIPKL